MRLNPTPTMNGPPKKGAWGRVVGPAQKKDACPAQAQASVGPAMVTSTIRPEVNASGSDQGLGRPRAGRGLDWDREPDRLLVLDWHTHSGLSSFWAESGAFE